MTTRMGIESFRALKIHYFCTYFMAHFFRMKYLDRMTQSANTSIYVDMFIFPYDRHYINYKLMKKKVNRYTQQIEIGTQYDYYVLRDFSRLLDIQVSMYLR